MRSPNPRTPRPQSSRGLALEPLEPRQLLTSYLGQSLADYFHVPFNTVTSANDALTFAYSNSPTTEGAAVVDGQFLHYSQIPGLQADDTIEGVTDSDLIVGYSRPAGLSTRFIVRNGVRTLLSDAVVTVVSGGQSPNYAAMKFAKVANDGSILLSEENGSLAGPVWLFKGETLTFLWSGFATDIASDGAVLGSRGTYEARDAIIRTVDGKVTVVQGIFAEAVGPGGLVIGEVKDEASGGYAVATWKEGHIAILTPPSELIHPATSILGSNSIATWKSFGGDSAGNVLVTLENLKEWPGTYRTERYLIDTGGSVLRLDSIMSGLLPDPGRQWDYIRMTSSGDILTTDAVYTRSEDGEDWAVTGPPGAPAATDGANMIAAVSAYGDATIWDRQSGRWHAGAVFGMTPGAGAGFYDVLTYLDPSTSLVHAFLTTPSGSYWMTQDPASSTWVVRVSPYNPVHGPFTGQAVFLSADGRAQLASVNTAGHLLLTYELDGSITSTTNWVTVDLTDHLAGTGQAFVPVSSNLTAWTMPWGAMNIAYLDSSGNAQVVWCTPGLPNWRIDSLSQSAGFTGTFHGILTSYTTPWNGQNVTGTDASGDLVTLWWTPGLPSWRADRLVGGTPAQLDENTITGFSTPWGGLNVVGLNKQTGKLTAYWWAPGMPAWIVEEFKITGAPANLQLKGRISAAVAPNGNMFLAAVTSDNHLANIWISPDTGLKWTFEDATMAV